MLIIFSVKDQNVSHDQGHRSLVAGSSGEVKAVFSFDESWDDYYKVVVFSNSNQRCRDIKPIRYRDDAIVVPDDALVAGKLYVSVIGFTEDGKRKTTRKWDIQQAITVQECGILGGCNLLREVAMGGTVSPDKVAQDGEVNDMLDGVFGGTDATPSVGDDEVATDDDVLTMLDEIFGSRPENAPEGA